MKSFLPALLAILATASLQLSAAPRPAVPPADRIEVFPSSVTLESRRAYRQIVVTGFFHGEPRDLTAVATFNPSSDAVKVEKGRIAPLADGKTVVTVKAGGRSSTIPVTVRNFTKSDPVQFKFETQAVLTKQGCATGSCHGSPHGKGGFSLSLFGYDAAIDRISLTRDGFNRRINKLEPNESLILKKPLLEIPHVGGKRLRREDAAYAILRDWIAQGANAEIPRMECEKITLFPERGRVLQPQNRLQQISVLAHFSDGSVRDVTRIARFESSDGNVAGVDPNGLVTGNTRGQAAVSIRYLDKLESVHFTVVENTPGFTWNSPPENNFVDRLVHQKLKQLQYLPSADISDAVFLRRVCLDLTGMLPSPEQARRFLADRSAGRRSKLVDALLETEEYARFWALKKADLMRVSPQKLKDGRAELFAGWLVDAVRSNMPYDQFARAILTAAGDTHTVAPANYFLAIPTKEERTEMTAQLFMGSRVECAKCHNHPFENWTMRDYYSFAAVYARTEAEEGEVRLASAGEALHPTTKEVMKPWGSEKAAATTDRRIGFVQWLTKPGNPLFARVEVNRIWADLMGRGIVEPVDDFRSSNPPANSELLDALAREFEKSGYDRKHMIRLICNSRTYQRSSATNRFNATDETLFSHARVRLLTAEQLKDALGVTTQTLLPAPGAAAQLSELRKQLAAKEAALKPGYDAWREEKKRTAAELAFRQGGWSTVGPRHAESVEKGLSDALWAEGGRKPGSQDTWQWQPAFREGSMNRLVGERRGVLYARRRIVCAEPMEVVAQFKPSEAGMVWLNGKLITQQAVKSDTRLSLPLVKGENILMVSAASVSDRPGFTFRVADGQPAADAFRKAESILPSALLEVAEKGGSEQERTALYEHYLNEDGAYHGLREQVTRLESRMEYATQRPYPDLSAFSVTFGQPERQSACTCERQTSPTLLQALELLNGGTAFRMAQTAAEKYGKLGDEALIEELYLAGLCRYPTEREKRTAKAYLKKSPDRKTAVTDLVWTLVNTQEFLFQH